VTDEEFAALLKHCTTCRYADRATHKKVACTYCRNDDEFRQILIVMRHTTMRPGELRQLEWDEVELKNHRVAMAPKKIKTRRRRSITLLPDVENVLEARRQAAIAEHGGAHRLVFPTMNGNEWKGVTFSQRFRRLRTRAVKAGDLQESKKGEKLVLYSTRHTRITEMFVEGKCEALQQREAAQVEALPVQHRHAAGIDFGSRSHWVCVGFTSEAASCLIREFPAHTDGLKAIAAFLREHQVTTIALESTGIYWVPLYELLQAEGFKVLLVDPSYTRQLRGRPKTDRRDCQWIYRLHSVGLLAAAFRPDEKTCQLRAYLRQRGNLIRQASKHVQHMQKALEQMNLKLTEVLSDITGVTGRTIIRAILRGTRSPEKLAKYRDKQCKASAAEIAQALTGSYREEHLFELKLAYEAWQFTLGQVGKVDAQIALQLGRMKSDRALPPLKPKARPKRRASSPGFEVRAALYYVVVLDLTEIEGISELTALTLISEIGPGVSQFATVKKFCSWLGLCPNWQKTGGRVKSSRTRRGSIVRRRRCVEQPRVCTTAREPWEGSCGG
jgi:transposase